jgi:hypothetical protein
MVTLARNPTVQADAAAERSVDDEQRRHRMRGGLHGVEVELDVGQRLDGGEDDGEVFGTAPGHHGVGRDLLDGGLALARRQDADQLARIALGPA